MRTPGEPSGIAGDCLSTGFGGAKGDGVLSVRSLTVPLKGVVGSVAAGLGSGTGLLVAEGSLPAAMVMPVFVCSTTVLPLLARPGRAMPPLPKTG